MSCTCGHDHEDEVLEAKADASRQDYMREVEEGESVVTDESEQSEVQAAPPKEAELTLTVAPQTAQVFAQAFALVSQGQAITIRLAGN